MKCERFGQELTDYFDNDRQDDMQRAAQPLP